LGASLVAVAPDFEDVFLASTAGASHVHPAAPGDEPEPPAVPA